MLTELPDLEQGSEEWLDQRRGMLTASVIGQLITTRTLTAIDFECPDCEASAYSPCVSKRDGKPIATLHPARAAAARDDDSPAILEVARDNDAKTLTLTLVAERITGVTEPSFMSADMWRGREYEPLARDLYSDHRAPVEEIGFMVRTEDWGTLGFSPDGLVGDDGLIEVKSPKAKTHLQTILTGEMPDRYMAQAQAGLLVSGRKWLDFISCCADMSLWTKRVEPDPRWFEAITEAVRSFEKDAAAMQAQYAEATEGLPITPRIDLEIVI